MAETKRSVADHSRQSCQAASRKDSQLLPYGDVSNLLEGSNTLQACSVSCYTVDNVKVTRGWTFPDGTVCKQSGSGQETQSFCMEGVCQEFSCEDTATYQLHQDRCREQGKPAVVVETPVADSSSGWTGWKAVSGCSFSCLVPARGLQMMTRRCVARVCEGIDSTIGLCQDRTTTCNKLITPFQFASQTCDNFKISKLSGIGMQLSSTTADPDRACKVACQDRDFSYRFYMVSGEKGWFPYGTDCSRGIGRKDSFCVKVTKRYIFLILNFDGEYTSQSFILHEYSLLI